MSQVSVHKVSASLNLPVRILAQPDDETCGPTCLHAVYQYWGDTVSLPEVQKTSSMLCASGAGRGTLAVLLGLDALARGYQATLLTFNLSLFDPTWFDEFGDASADLADKLKRQNDEKASSDPRFNVATAAYVEFLARGGRVRFCDLTSRLIIGNLQRGVPVLCGLSATYLYRCAREFGPKDDYDDIRGTPAGHFVILHGYDAARRRVIIADPLADNPGFGNQGYEVPMSRLVSAVMLGVLTHDANLLLIEPNSI